MTAAARRSIDPQAIDTRYFTRFERVSGVTRTERGILAEVHGQQLRIDVLHDDVLRIKISRGRRFDEQPTFAVTADLDAATARFSIEETGGAVHIRTRRMVLSLWLDPFHLDAYRADGSLIFESYRDADGSYWAYATLNDAFVVGRTCRREDAFFGLGEKTGSFNRIGRDFTLWNTDVLNPAASGEFAAGRSPDDQRSDNTSTEFDPYYVSVPLLYHMTDTNRAMAGFFVDNSYRGRYELSHRTSYWYRFDGGQYTEYVFAGPTMREILESYTWLTGRMLPPPLWALGYHQCRWFHYTQAAVERLAARHREKQIPCDALWLDIDYMDGYRVFTWNQQAFPDVPGMLGRLAEQGFRTITIVDPGIKYEPGYPIFDQAVERDMLCKTEGGDIYVGQVWPGKTAFPDFVLPEARAWWGELNAAHVKYGLAGIWNDMNEPATGDIPPYAMRFANGRYAHERFHNQYALLMAMGTTEGLLKAMPERRTFVLSRAGFAGIQRYAANWMGDNLSRWDHLWMSVPMALGFGVSGQPFVGADIGGFGGSSNAELFLRWMQCGALTPFCRNHSAAGNIDQYAWAFGEVVEALVRGAIELRYRLLPYMYAAFLRATETGEPVQQPLVLAFQDDRAVRDIDDQYLLGSQLLVAPIYTPGATSRQVYLPAGTWYHWYTGEQFAGKRYVIAPAPMDYIPLYVRGGAVVAMWPDAPASTDGYHPRVIELHIFIPHGDGEFNSVLHEDDGLSFAFGDGAYYRTDFILTRTQARLSLRAEVSGDGYAEFARQAFELVFHGPTPQAVQLDGQALQLEHGRAVVPNTGSGFVLDAELAA